MGFTLVSLFSGLDQASSLQGIVRVSVLGLSYGRAYYGLRRRNNGNMSFSRILVIRTSEEGFARVWDHKLSETS